MNDNPEGIDSHAEATFTEAAQQLQDAFASLEAPRYLTLYQQRFLALKPKTLVELGETLGVSGARVLQLEEPAKEAIRAALGDEGTEALEAARDHLFPGGAVAVKLEELGQAFPTLMRPVPAVGIPLHQVLGRLGNHWEEENGWLAKPTAAKARAATEKHLRKHADKYGVADKSEATMVHSPTGAEESVDEWLDECGIRVHGNKAALDTRSIKDYAAAVLSIEGEPLTKGELLDRFQHARRRNERSLGNALTSDSRFHRTSRTHWGLSEWDHADYSSIRTLIGEIVEREGGEVPLQTLTEELVEKHGVSAKSVATYCAGQWFQSRDGIVSKTGHASAGSGSPSVGGPPVSIPELLDTRRLYRSKDGWVYRVPVTKNHLRGSGAMVPQAVANALRVAPGQRVAFASPLKNHHVSWRGAQPAVGTIRVHLEAAGLEEGQEALLCYGDDRTFKVHPVQAQTGDALVDAAALVSPEKPATSVEATQTLFLAATGKTEPFTGTQDDLALMFADKGDEDVAGVLRTPHGGAPREEWSSREGSPDQ